MLADLPTSHMASMEKMQHKLPYFLILSKRIVLCIGLVMIGQTAKIISLIGLAFKMMNIEKLFLDYRVFTILHLLEQLLGQEGFFIEMLLKDS